MPKKKRQATAHLSRQKEVLSHPLVADSLDHFLRGDYDIAVSLISTLESTIPLAPSKGAAAESGPQEHLLEGSDGESSEVHSVPHQCQSELDNPPELYDPNHREALPTFVSSLYANAPSDLSRVRTLLSLSDSRFINCPYRIQSCINIADSEFANGNISSALEFYLLACVESNSNSDAWNNLGLCYFRLGQLEPALDNLLKASNLNPAYHIPLFNLGLVYKGLGNLPQSERSFRLSLAYDNSYINSYLQLAQLFKEQSRAIEADCFYRLACFYSPAEKAESAYCYGLFLFERHCPAEAISQFQHSIDCEYELLNSLYNSALCHRDLGHFSNAISMLCRCIELDPNNYNLHLTIGFLYTRNRNYESAFSHYRTALRLNPSDLTSLSNLIYASNFSRHVSIDEEISAAIQWENYYRASNHFVPLSPFDFNRTSLNGRKLRVGILSSEIGNHAISRFLKPFMQYIDKNKFSVFIYQGTARNDELSPSLLSLADRQFDATGMSDEDLTSIIRDDCIDILIETSAHMRANRLGVVCRRAAPIQMHYIGYHGTTGVSSLDYIIADDVLVPHASESQFIEQVARLPRVWVCYEPPVSDLPDISCSLSRSEPVFGSFNNLEKLSSETILVWSRLLKHHPNSSLLLKDGLATADLVRSRILSTFESFGIHSSRVHFRHYSSSWVEHMNLYNDISIALDTYPLNSGTTAFDALAMGVPVVGLQGSLMGSRLTSSILTAIGKEEWIASGSDEYLDIVNHLLSVDQDCTSNAFRHDLRQLFFQSSLCDGPSLSCSISNLLADTFNQWYEKSIATSSP